MKEITKLRQLCRKFVGDVQNVLDHSNMDQEAYETSEVAQAAVLAQGYAQEASEVPE